MSLAVVCCEGADSLALVELETGRLRGTIPVGRHPVHATLVDGRVCVATMGERAISIVDLNGRVHRVSTGVLGPSHIASTGDLLFVPCTAGDAVAVIDPTARTLERRIRVGSEPHEIAIHGDRAYVGSRGDGTVDVIDVETRAVVRSIDIDGEARVQGLAIHPECGRGYAIDQRGSRVVSFGPVEDGSNDDEEPHRTAQVGANPYDLALRADRLYVPGRDAGTVHAFDPDLTLDRVYRGFDSPVDVIAIAGDEWVVDRSAAEIRSLDGRTVETSAPAIGGTPVGDRLLLSHYRDDRLSLIDPEGGVIWTTETPAYPFGIVVV